MSKTLENACGIFHNPLFAPEYTHVLEFGVWKGDTLELIYNTVPTKYKIYGFDSFLGLPEDWLETDYKKGSFSLNGIIPDKVKNLQNVKIFVGLFADTIPMYLKEAENIALLHIDCDLYSSTIDILYSDIHKYIKPGTYIIFDDWKYLAVWRKDIKNEGQHNQKAFKEWVRKFGVKYELLNTIEPFRQAIKILKIR